MALTRSFPTSRNFLATGLVGIIGYTVTDLAGNILSVRTTAGITESPASSGVYIAIALLDPAWDGYLVWDDGSGAPGSYLSERFDATGASTATGPDPTNVLLFINDEGGTLTDLDFAPVLRDSANTYGVKRADTGNVIVAAGAASMTHVSTGVYSYDPGLAYVDVPLTYAVEYTAGGVTLHADGLFRAAMGAHYSNVALLRLKLGQTNADANAAGSSQDLESTGVQAQIDAQEEYALTESDDRVNLKLIGAGITLPFVAPTTYVTAQVRKAATAYAAGYVLKFRGDQTRTAQGATPAPNPGDLLIAEGDAIMDALIEAGALTVTTEDDAYTVAAPVAAGPTVDANGCPLPPIACYPYGGYYSRLSCN